MRLPTGRVESESESDHAIQGPFRPDVEDHSINAGKTSTVLDFDALPRINGNNYRQALTEAPGIVLSEETTHLLAPAHVVRAGLIYSRGDAVKVGLLGTAVARSFGDDGNSAERVLPAHAVCDLTAEVRIPGTRVRLVGGINNLLDEDCYSRVSNAGLDPAPRRNGYAGASLAF